MSNVIPFKSGRGKRQRGVRNSRSISGFRIVQFGDIKVVSLLQHNAARALGFDWSAIQLCAEMDDPLSHGRRMFNPRFVIYDGVRWTVQWMNRTFEPGKMHYGLNRG